MHDDDNNDSVNSYEVHDLCLNSLSVNPTKWSFYEVDV